MNRAEEILKYWFIDLDAGEAGPDRFALWFGKSDKADDEIKRLFETGVENAGRGDYDSWREDPRSSIALVILLDQFPRNIFRNTPKAFAFDPKAREVVLKGLENGTDKKLPPLGRFFFYLPLEHSEELEHQRMSEKHFRRLMANAPAGMGEQFKMIYDYAVKHLEIIERFGRFPHRNEILGRASSPEEVEFLKEPGSSF